MVQTCEDFVEPLCPMFLSYMKHRYCFQVKMAIKQYRIITGKYLVIQFNTLFLRKPSMENCTYMCHTNAFMPVHQEDQYK